MTDKKKEGRKIEREKEGLKERKEKERKINSQRATNGMIDRGILV